MVKDRLFKRSSIGYCELCRRNTTHTSINRGKPRCDNCSRGFCELPACGVIIYNVDVK